MNTLTHVTLAGRDRTQKNMNTLTHVTPAVTGLKTTHMNTLTHLTMAGRDRTQNNSHEHTNFTWNLAAITHRLANAEQKSQVSETHQPDSEMRVCGDCGLCNTNSSM